MTCSKSFALGRWRGAMGRPLAVPLADTVCDASYVDGHEAGRAERAERAAQSWDSARRTKGRR